jgi:hypothetical protein
LKFNKNDPPSSQNLGCTNNNDCRCTKPLIIAV